MIAVAFWLLLFGFLSRLYFVVKHGSSASFLTAMGIGVLGLFCTGVLVPQAVLDSVLGGVNFLHLLRNLCITYAVWLIRDGVVKAFGDESNRAKFIYRRRFLALITAAIITPFLFQQFVPTTNRYVPENVDHAPVLVYATVYMTALGFLAGSVVRTCLRSQSSRAVRLSARGVAAGMSLIVLACVVEIVYMQLQSFGLGTPAVRMVLYRAFSPLLYSGVVVISLSLALPLLVRVLRTFELVSRTTLIILEASPAMVTPTEKFAERTRRIGAAWTHRDPSGAVYEHIIRESDRRVSGSRPLPPVTRRALDAAEKRLDRSFDLTLEKGLHEYTN